MAAEGGNNIVWFTYTGQEEIPDEATHIIVDVRTIPRRAFYCHRNIVEVICHEDVKQIGKDAFIECPNLRRVIMPGVKVVEWRAFQHCEAITHVECCKLEIIKELAFSCCKSLRSIDLPSIRIVERWAFNECEALMDVKFGSKLESIEEGVFMGCTSLERITIPLKDGLITDDDIFQACGKLKHVDFFGGELHEFVDALLLEDWKYDIGDEIDSINQILPDVSAGWLEDDNVFEDYGQKARVIRWWITVVLGKIDHYKSKHQRILNEAGTTLQLALPREIVMNNVLPFLALPSHTFEVEDQDMEENDSVHDEGMQDDY